jgi:hypothetical protein
MTKEELIQMQSMYASMPDKVWTEEDELNKLKTSIKMLLGSKKEAEEKGNKAYVNLLVQSINENVNNMLAIDKNIDVKKLMTELEDGNLTTYEQILLVEEPDENATISEKIEMLQKKADILNKSDLNDISFTEEKEVFVDKPTTSTNHILDNDVDVNVDYDIVKLPSKGQAYKHKSETVPVSYLTAQDENFITSPNLYHDGLIVDLLLKRKILNSTIEPDELLVGDADAITLFLRVTAYGPEYPILATDPVTGVEFETSIDLSKFKMKDFNLTADENGYFDFTMPVSQNKIKFKFLTRKDEKNVVLLNMMDDLKTKGTYLKDMHKVLTNILSKDEVVTKDEKDILNKSLDNIKKWGDKVNKNNSIGHYNIITNKLEMSIVSVDGNTDKKFIKSYINKLPARDSLEFRRYLLANEPGIDWTVNIEKPESLGGGSFVTTFQYNENDFFLSVK